ncbi:MAG: DUF4384 domain-containing protein [Oligoflexia bacterium]|nr:DUF4384 domain-containing protein [Oligoflexia bacterium]
MTDDRTRTHLDSASLQALFEGDLSAARARALLGHLEAGCEQCQDLLDSEGPSLDTLLRLVQAELAAPVSPPVDLWQGIAARQQPSATQPRPASRHRRWAVWGTVLAMAAGLSLVILPRLPGPDDTQPGVKGSGAVLAPTVALRVVVGRVTDAGFDLDRRVSEGDQIRPDQTLLFELSVNRSAARYLFFVDGEDQATLLSPTAAPQVMPAGATRVSDAGQWVALTVDDLVGPLTLVAVAGPVVENPDAQVVNAWTRHQLPEGFGTAALHVELAP